MLAVCILGHKRTLVDDPVKRLVRPHEAQIDSNAGPLPRKPIRCRQNHRRHRLAHLPAHVRHQRPEDRLL